ncbi:MULTISPECIES: U32 family peptidase [unclassified Sedimentibacter]|uniref:U32 family peptidase n=1 Tax=unclassified Sedimentibacter TaxID=2649220 RepID=UPI0027DF19AF|nr:U32 family peptidase [Sedimentibacter sp. MB35-C1]WMJ76557.1 U32 family peptidase [Sedimentibacter sp. MB35-C1]
MKQKAELLAPAGSIESFYAAVNSGADSVYLGGKLFNARYNSQNFDNDEMQHIISYAHNKNVKVYVTLNIVLKDTEIGDALNYAMFLYENDVDAVIVQDIGLLYLIRRFIPDIHVNISTQAAVYDEFGIKFFEYYDVSKVILAREMSMEQLKEAALDTDSDLEVFIHGALCMCYSGQCYMSSFLGGRSGNRGKCAQPCRLSYKFYDKQRSEMIEDFGEIPLLSLKDFMAGDSLPELIESGIKTFKIEGRMKGPEYTSAVVEYYRQIIDGYYEGRNIDISKNKQRAIATFSRGYTNSYLKPSGDDVMFAKTSSGVKGDNIDEIQEETRDKAQEFSSYRRTKINFEISLKIGSKAILKVSDGKNEAISESNELCETSLKNAAIEEIIRDQLGKLGNSIYELNSVAIDADENVFVRKSTLNQLRRDAIELLYSKGSIYHNRIELERIPLNILFDYKHKNNEVLTKLSLKINSNEEMKLVDKNKVYRVYIPYDLDVKAAEKIDVKEKYLYLPNIISKDQYDILRKNIPLYESIFDGVCVNNAGSFYFFSENSNLKIHCGQFFNIINTFSVKLLEEREAEGYTFSVEANIKDMESVIRNNTMKSEVAAHEYVQLMVMKNCPMSLMKNCKNMHDCNGCSYRNRYALNDRKNAFFNIERSHGLTYIYNSVQLSILGKTKDFLNAGVEYFMVDTKWLDKPEEVIDALYCEINNVDGIKILKANNFTRGHYLKNIL